MRKAKHYYARNEEERNVDNTTRDAVRSKGNKSDMALYIQNQMILSALRRIEDDITNIKGKIIK